jgi:hypothetical protein
MQIRKEPLTQKPDLQRVANTEFKSKKAGATFADHPHRLTARSAERLTYKNEKSTGKTK